jgi:hypothetical protein
MALTEKKITYLDLESAKRPVLVVEATLSKPLPFTQAAT